MKIIYLVSARIPTEKAFGLQIVKMCEEFALQNIDIELWLPASAKPFVASTFEYYKTKKTFKIKYLSSFDFLPHVAWLGRWSNYGQAIAFALKIFFARIPKDALLYCRNPEIVFILKLKGHRTVYECQDWPASFLAIKLFLLKNTDQIICANNYVRQNFIEKGFNEAAMLTASNGVDLSIFGICDSKLEAVQGLNLANEQGARILNSTVLLYTGSYKTMEVGMGIEEILEALKIIKDDKLYFVAVGGSESHINFYKDLARQLGVGANTLFLGRHEQKDMALFQRASDILLMPFPDKAHGKYHLTPLKIFEYLAAGKPIIASDLPCIREVLNENNAVFCEPGNASDLAFAIRNTASNSNLALFISKNAVAESRKYTWKNRAKKILDFLYVEK